MRKDEMPRQWEGNVRIPSGCAISGIIDTDGNCFNGREIIESISVMHDRSNGLGGGFAGYGIYPQYKELYALHVFYDSQESKKRAKRIWTGITILSTFHVFRTSHETHQRRTSDLEIFS